MTYVLHYAPDNASLIVRLALDHGRIPYTTVLVDRRGASSRQPRGSLPALHSLCARVETLPCCDALQKAEGLGITPFTNPHYPNPPEGSAT